MTITRTQKEIVNAMHRLRKPATVYEIAETSQISWITVKNNLAVLEKNGLVTDKTEKKRQLWTIKYEVFD